MRWLLLFAFACGTPSSPKPKVEPKPEPVAAPVAKWRVPDKWRSEDIPFPLDFAPTIAHQGVEELRFPPGFFKPDAPDYWSYAFTWRTTDAANLDAKALGDELTVYFRGLIAAVDKDKKQVKTPDVVVAHAVANGTRFDLHANVFDAFGTGQPVELFGWAERTACGTGAIWVFVLAPKASAARAELDALATEAKTTCRE